MAIADTRTVALVSPSQSSSAFDTRWMTAIVPTRRSSSPPSRRSRSNSSSTEKRKNSGPTGRSSGGVAPTSPRGIEQHADDPHPHRQVPGRQRKRTAGNDRAHELRHRLFRASEVEDREVADDRVEARV